MFASCGPCGLVNPNLADGVDGLWRAAPALKKPWRSTWCEIKRQRRARTPLLRLSEDVAVTGTRSCGSSLSAEALPCSGSPQTGQQEDSLMDFPPVPSPRPPAPALPSDPGACPSPPGAGRPAPALCVPAAGAPFAVGTSCLYLLLAGLGCGCSVGSLQSRRAGATLCGAWLPSGWRLFLGSPGSRGRLGSCGVFT